MDHLPLTFGDWFVEDSRDDSGASSVQSTTEEHSSYDPNDNIGDETYEYMVHLLEDDEVKEYPFEVDLHRLKLVSQSTKDVISGYIRENERELLLIIPELVILICILFYYEIEKGQEIEEKKKTKRKDSRCKDEQVETPLADEIDF